MCTRGPGGVVAAPGSRITRRSAEKGGFGVVYRCNQRELDRTVACAMLTPILEPTIWAVVRERYKGKLSGHPHIVNIFKVG